VLHRIAADLDHLSGHPTTNEGGDPGVDPSIAGIKHRRRLAEPELELSSLSQREQRAILREKMGLSPYYSGFQFDEVHPMPHNLYPIQ
jgi:hypothetical protein